MPWTAVKMVSRIYEIGNKQRDLLSGGTGNGDTRNWENGMKIADLLDSAIRHITAHLEGDRSEPHLSQAMWNLLNALQTSIWVYTGQRPPELNNLPDHIHPWKPGNPSPCPLSSQEIEWLETWGIQRNEFPDLNDPVQSASHLAALVDGEGTISIVKRETKRREAYRLSIRVYNTSETLKNYLEKRWGATTVRRKGRRKIHKDCYTMIWTSSKAEDILRRIWPYLIIKTAQANLAVAFQTLVKNINPGCKGIPEKTLQQLRFMKEEINRMNEKGPK